MQHPKQLVLAGSPLVILGEDVAAANGTMAALELTLEGILAVEALPEAVALGVGLMAFNAVLSPRDSSRATRIPLPLWLNLLAVSEATAEKTCADLRAEQTAACRDQPPEPCGKYDSCDELRAKRKPLVECARAWKALAGKDCAVAAGDEDSKAQNGKGLKLCGKLISGNPACCSDDVKRQKKTACPSDLRGCADDAKVSDAEYLALDPAGQVAVCAAIAAKKIGAAACLIARVRERDECFQGLDEPQHAGEIEKADRMIRNCDDALANLSVLRVCP